MIRPDIGVEPRHHGRGPDCRSVLLLRGEPSGCVLGCHIDAQFGIGCGLGQVGFVVLVSYDDMFSAVERAYFVDRAGVIRDKLTMGHATEQGLITEVTIDGADVVSFAFRCTGATGFASNAEPVCWAWGNDG